MENTALAVEWHDVKRVYARKTRQKGTNLKQAFVACGVICTSCGNMLIDEKWMLENKSRRRGGVRVGIMKQKGKKSFT